MYYVPNMDTRRVPECSPWQRNASLSLSFESFNRRMIQVKIVRCPTGSQLLQCNLIQVHMALRKERSSQSKPELFDFTNSEILAVTCNVIEVNSTTGHLILPPTGSGGISYCTHGRKVSNVGSVLPHQQTDNFPCTFPCFPNCSGSLRMYACMHLMI